MGNLLCCCSTQEYIFNIPPEGEVSIGHTKFYLVSELNKANIDPEATQATQANEDNGSTGNQFSGEQRLETSEAIVIQRKYNPKDLEKLHRLLQHNGDNIGHCVLCSSYMAGIYKLIPTHNNL